MEAKQNNLHPGGGAAVEETFFTEEAEEEARPVVPLGRVGHAGAARRRARGRLPRSFILALALIAAGSAGATAGYLAYLGRALQPATEATTNVASEPDPPPPTVSNSTDTPTAEKSDVRARSETPARVELDDSRTNRVDVRGEDKEEHTVRVREEEPPRREMREMRVERRRERDEVRDGRREGRGRIVPGDGEKGGKPKARLVGTITGRSRPY
jgi:hypothetical protein